jgi:2-methylisocitrate lyase-like PEP mutase family enzyme
MPTTAEKRFAFHRLHESGCFVLPNPWDVGSARYLQHLGFKAVATTSSGAAFSMGLPDADWAVPRDTMLAHVTTIVKASDLPVNADFESGYAHDPPHVAANVSLCVETGVAGLSIEDATGDPAKPLYEPDLAVERIRAARAAIDAAGAEVVLTARTECFLVGRPDLAEATLRLEAFAEAGADCLYAPGIATREQIEAVVAAVAPRPVNVLVGGASQFSVRDLAGLGVRRISVGSALARAAWGGFLRAARGIAETGRFDALADAAPFAELNTFFRQDLERRKG